VLIILCCERLAFTSSLNVHSDFVAENETSFETIKRQDIKVANPGSPRFKA
jgi:hypothetical protein